MSSGFAHPRSPVYFVGVPGSRTRHPDTRQARLVGSTQRSFGVSFRGVKSLCLLVLLVGCDSSSEVPPDARPDTPPADAAVDAAAGFGDLAGMCGVLTDTELTDGAYHLVEDSFTFARAYVDPDDRGLLTPGGVHLIETPNAGGSSEMSELFAFEQLARCEGATLVKTETEITYTDTGGKKTDILVMIDGHKIGVSVTRAFAFPIGTPYSETQARTLLTRKLDDIGLSSANVTAADAWEKQILAYQAIDDQAAQAVIGVWNTLDMATRDDTILLVTVTNGDDLFIYQN